MVNFTDIHCHLLGGVDDGAIDDNDMYAMLDMAYSSGTRNLCLTPHFNPGIWKNNKQQSNEAFARLREYTDNKYSDMHIYLGNELYYYQSCIDNLNSGLCRTLNGGRYVLVDFQFGSSYYEIRSALLDLLNSGYIPVFAHVERYSCIKLPFKTLFELKDFGVIIQVNSTSLCGGWGRALQKKALKILKAGLADVVASDAHNTLKRNPCLDSVAAVINKYFNEEYVEVLLKTNSEKILGISKN